MVHRIVPRCDLPKHFLDSGVALVNAGRKRLGGCRVGVDGGIVHHDLLHVSYGTVQ